MFRQAITPIDKKVDQVDQSSQKRDSAQVSDINKTKPGRDEDEKKLDATSEIAKTADNQSKGAMSKANQNAKDLSDFARWLRISMTTSRQPGGRAFWLSAKNTLTTDEKAKLDDVAKQIGFAAAVFHHGGRIHGSNRAGGLQRPPQPGARKFRDFSTSSGRITFLSTESTWWVWASRNSSMRAKARRRARRAAALRSPSILRSH